MQRLDPKNQAQPAPTPPQTEDRPKRSKLPPNAPGSFDTIADVDSCPSISAVKPL